MKFVTRSIFQKEPDIFFAKDLWSRFVRKIRIKKEFQQISRSNFKILKFLRGMNNDERTKREKKMKEIGIEIFDVFSHSEQRKKNK